MKNIEFEKPQELTFFTREAISKLRVNLGFMGKDIKTIMITSSVPNEGKSFISFNLWKTASESGKKCLLIDVDLRNSRLRKDHDMQFYGGIPNTIAHVLSGQVPVEEAIYSTNIKNGYILPITSSVANPSILLSNGVLKELLENLRDEYEYIFLDTPPILSVADALQIAEYCDGSVLVIRANSTKRKDVEEAYHSLERTGKPILGTVLNRAQQLSQASEYYYGYYDSEPEE